MKNDEEKRDLGVQPLDKFLTELGFGNSDLVAASTEQLTHKQVQKSRKGRRVTPNIQSKVLNAVNALAGGEKNYKMGDLFNY